VTFSTSSSRLGGRGRSKSRRARSSTSSGPLLGFLPAEQIEATAIAGLDGRPPPPSIAAYVELSLIAKVLIPSGRWTEAEARLEAIEPGQLTAAAKLVQEPVLGALALRRGDLGRRATWLADVKAVALESGEVQRIVPDGVRCRPVAPPRGRREELREATDEILDAVGDLWPVVLTTDPMARALDAAGEAERLAALAESLAGSGAPIGRAPREQPRRGREPPRPTGGREPTRRRRGSARRRQRNGCWASLSTAPASRSTRRAPSRPPVRQRKRCGSARAEELIWALDCVNPF
jgi:hypothetical protein